LTALNKAAKFPDRIWRCLHCHGSLAVEASGLHCKSCGRNYPEVSGIPILVKDPASYLRSELAALNQASSLARERLEQIGCAEAGPELPQLSIDRHRDVLESEISQARMFRALLEPVPSSITAEKQAPARPSGWAIETLLPYLIRDWTNTSELSDARTMIGTMLERIFPVSAGKTLAVAGCGAGGLLTEMAFEHVVGFDLTLPILGAARHLLDGKSLEVRLPRAIHPGGYIGLHPHDAKKTAPDVMVAVMDAFETGFADGALDCVVTSFLIDLLPDPRRLAAEIYRILSSDGVWINYGPSGPLKATWRFDNAESAAFFETVGFSAIHAEAHRTTYLDLSREMPSWSTRNHMCYLTAARKIQGHPRFAERRTQLPLHVERAVPSHYPSALIIRRQSMAPDSAPTIALRCERLPGQMKNFAIVAQDPVILELVDGKRSVQEIAEYLARADPARSVDGTHQAFMRYFKQGLLAWRD
jgi:SAM-dependent methyltransferase